MKRIIIATLMGMISGGICVFFAYNQGQVPKEVIMQIFVSRSLIGFAIGISVLKFFHWSLHGLLMGLIFSIPLAISGLMAPENPDITRTVLFVSTIVMGMIYGLLIEIVTSLLFKEKQKIVIQN